MKDKIKYTKLIHFQELFKILSTDTNIAHLLGKITKSFQLSLAKIQSSNDDIEFDLPQFELKIFDDSRDKKIFEKHNAKLLIGGVFRFSKGEVAYQSIQLCISFSNYSVKNSNVLSKTINSESCCLLNYANGKFQRIVRKFHFDIQPNTKANLLKQNNIIETHMQYGGRFKLPDPSLGNFHYCLDHWLEKPRIFFPPLDLVLFLEFIRREFNTYFSNIVKNPKWKALVKKSEKLYWEEYYKKILQESKNKKTMFEILYENPN